MKKSKKLQKKKLWSKYRKHNIFVIAGALVLLLGLILSVYALRNHTNLQSKAVTANPIEPESGTFLGSITSVDDQSASGGKYIVFGSATDDKQSNTNGCAPEQSENKPTDTGLTKPFQCPDPVSGKTISVLSYGATSNNASNDDATAITSAINAARAGDEVYIPDGVYDLKKPDIALKTGVSIRGQSQSGTILRTVYNKVHGSVFNAAPGTSNLTVSNIHFTKNGGSGMDGIITLGNGSMDNNNSGYQQVSRISIKNNLFEQFNSWGLAIYNGYHIEVANNTFTNATSVGDGGAGYGMQIAYDRSQENWVHDNNAIGPMIRHAYLIQFRAHHTLMENNKADKIFSDAFDLHGEKEYSNELRNNVVTNCGEGTDNNNYAAAFGVGETPPSHNDSGPNNWIHHNEASNCYAGTAITTTNSTYVFNNTFTNSAFGIKVGDPKQSDKNVLKANRIANNTKGIFLEKTVGTVLEKNIVTNSTDAGLTIQSGTTRYTITSNDFRNNGKNVIGNKSNGSYSGNVE